jgi:hypothetical protein
MFKAGRLAAYAMLSARLKFSHGKAAEAVTDLIATLHLARHVSVDPNFSCLSVGLRLEEDVIQTAAAGLKDMDAAAMNNLVAGLDALPAGGTMAAVMAESRRRMAALVSDLESANGQDTWALIRKHFGSGSAASVPRKSRDEVLSSLKAILAVADKWAAAMQIPDQKIGQFEQERDKLMREGRAVSVKLHVPIQMSVCIDGADRYLEARTRVLVPMLRAAITYRQGGKAAFDKVQDPYGDGPFEFILAGGHLEVISKVPYSKHTFTLPAAKGAK